MATTSESFCSLCHGDNIDTPAVSWCTHCREFLCSTCDKHHGRNRLFKHHHTISVENYQALPDFIKNISDLCEQHDERFEVYCGFHESACCVQCLIAEDHKKCPDFRKLSEVLTNVKSSALMSHTDEELTDILQNHEKILRHLFEQRTSIDEQKNRHINEIKQKRALINLHLDKLENELIQQLEQEVQNHVAKYNQLAIEVESEREKVQSMIKDQTRIKQHATDLQTFIAFDFVSKEVNMLMEYLRRIQNKQELYATNIETRLSTKLDSSFLDIEHFGDILVTRSNEPLQLELVETAQIAVQTKSYNSKYRTTKMIKRLFLTLLEPDLSSS